MKRVEAEAMADYLVALDRNLELAQEMRQRSTEPEVVEVLAELQAQQLTVIRFNANVLAKGET